MKKIRYVVYREGKFFVLFFLLFMTGKSVAQYITSCGISFQHEKYYCNLSLYPDGRYEIGLWEHEVEKVNDTLYAVYSVTNWFKPLSCGLYKTSGNIVTLTDKATELQMMIDTSNQRIRVIKSFSFLNGCTLNCLKGEGGDEEIRNHPLTHKMLILERSAYNKSTNDEIDLIPGDYSTNEKAGKPRYRLTLDRDNKYQLFINTLTLSEGIYTRNKNILLLYDTSLKHVFHLLIYKNMLVSKLIPGDLEGVKLRIENKN
ncbi:MAG: hypothetical protein IPH20_26630 [Bacteroidales bacterium]|nr:hypothetical protein [Bacteroidales bacterium]